jgi:hypothetical protein
MLGVFREKGVEKQGDKSKNVRQYENPRYVWSGFGMIRVPNWNQKFSSNPR